MISQLIDWEKINYFNNQFKVIFQETAAGFNFSIVRPFFLRPCFITL